MIIVEPTDGNGVRQLDGVTLGQAIRYGGQADWVVPATDDLHATRHHALVAGPLGGFEYDAVASSGLTASFATGESLIGGSYVASDDVTVTDANANVVHEVDLAASTAGQTVYLGVNHSGTDDMRIALESTAALDGGFTSAENPRIPLWTFDTDASAIIADTDERDTIPTVDRAATAKTAQSANTADTAASLSGIKSTQFLRSDVNDEAAGVIGFTARAALEGTLGKGQGEVARFASVHSDHLLSHQGGHGRVAWTWNCYYDGTVWRSIRSNEPHTLIGHLGVDPGEGVGTGNIVLATAPSNAAVGDAVSWTYSTLQEDGEFVIDGEHSVTSPDGESRSISVGSTAPSSPDSGDIWIDTS